MTPWSGTLVSFVPFSRFVCELFFHSFCNLLINKGVKRSRFARYDSRQHHVYASHIFTYIRYRCRFFLWTLPFLIHFLIPDVHLCNTSYYVGFESCSHDSAYVTKTYIASARRPAKYQVNSLRSFSSLEHIKLVIQKCSAAHRSMRLAF